MVPCVPAGGSTSCSTRRRCPCRRCRCWWCPCSGLCPDCWPSSWRCLPPCLKVGGEAFLGNAVRNEIAHDSFEQGVIAWRGRMGSSYPHISAQPMPHACTQGANPCITWASVHAHKYMHGRRQDGQGRTEAVGGADDGAALRLRLALHRPHPGGGWGAAQGRGCVAVRLGWALGVARWMRLEAGPAC